MNYMGGKMRQGKKIAEFVARLSRIDITYYEPFCGAMGSAHQVLAHRDFKAKGSVLSDASEPVVNMWKLLVDGWEPPDVVSEELYQAVRQRNDYSDPMTAYCGFGMSFGGKWWGGYARNGIGTDYALNLQRSALLKASVLLKASALLKACDYLEVIDQGQLFYLDPPYANRTKPHNYAGKFDHETFWNHCRRLVHNDNVVLATEFVAPDDFVPVHNWGDTVVRHHASKGGDGTKECIFMHESQAGLLR